MFTLLHQPFLNMVHKGGGGQKCPKGYTQNSTCFLSVFTNTHSTQDKWSLSPFFWLTEIFTSRLIRLNSFIFLSLEATCFFFETVELSNLILRGGSEPESTNFLVNIFGSRFLCEFFFYTRYTVMYTVSFLWKIAGLHRSKLPYNLLPFIKRSRFLCKSRQYYTPIHFDTKWRLQREKMRSPELFWSHSQK